MVAPKVVIEPGRPTRRFRDYGQGDPRIAVYRYEQQQPDGQWAEVSGAAFEAHERKLAEERAANAQAGWT